MIRLAAILAATTGLQAAAPSHITFCELSGIVAHVPIVEQSEGSQSPGPVFTFRVSKSQEFDSSPDAGSCREYQDTELEVQLPRDAQVPVQGDRLRISLEVTVTVDGEPHRQFAILQ